MITEDYVSFETSKLLKEKGFMDGTVVKFFASGYDKDGNILSIRETELEDYPRPTLQMTMKWLREEKELLISILPTVDKDGYPCLMYYIWDLADIYKDAIKSGLYSVENYGECAEGAIKYCLENLI